MIIKFNPSCKIVKVSVQERTFKDKKTNEDRKVRFLLVNVVDGDGDISAVKLYDPADNIVTAFERGKVLPVDRLEISGLELENGVSIVNCRMV